MNQIVKTAKNVNNEAPNTGEAKTFLARLDPTASKFRFLALSDGKKPIELYGSFEDQKADLTALNGNGYSIYVTLNEDNGRGRKAEDIVRARAIIIDADNGLPSNLPLEPSMTIETSPGKYQLFWFVSGLSLEEYEGIQRRLIAEYGCDPKVKDRSRVVRLPGFLNCKPGYGPDFPMARIVQSAPDRTREQILAAFPPMEASAKPKRPAKLKDAGNAAEKAGGKAAEKAEKAEARKAAKAAERAAWKAENPARPAKLDAGKAKRPRLTAEEVVKGCDIIRSALIKMKATGFEITGKGGVTWSFSLKATGCWKGFIRAAQDCAGDPSTVTEVYEALDKLSRLEGAPGFLRAKLTKVYHPRRNCEIKNAVLAPEDYEAETGEEAITARSFRAIVRQARKIVQQDSRNQYMAASRIMKGVREGWASPQTVNAIIAAEIVARTNKGKKRDVFLWLKDKIVAAEGKVFLIKSEDRAAVCKMFDISPAHLSKLIAEARDIFTVVPARHHPDNATTFGWKKETVNAAAMADAQAKPQSKPTASPSLRSGQNSSIHRGWGYAPSQSGKTVTLVREGISTVAGSQADGGATWGSEASWGSGATGQLHPGEFHPGQPAPQPNQNRSSSTQQNAASPNHPPGFGGPGELGAAEWRRLPAGAWFGAEPSVCFDGLQTFRAEVQAAIEAQHPSQRPEGDDDADPVAILAIERAILPALVEASLIATYGKAAGSPEGKHVRAFSEDLAALVGSQILSTDALGRLLADAARKFYRKIDKDGTGETEHRAILKAFREALGWAAYNAAEAYCPSVDKLVRGLEASAKFGKGKIQAQTDLNLNPGQQTQAQAQPQAQTYATNFSDEDYLRAKGGY